MAFYPETEYEILRDLISRIVSRTDLTDVRDGSVLAQILGAFSKKLAYVENQLFQLRNFNYLDNLVGEDLDLKAKAILPDGLLRTDASYSQSSGYFLRENTSGSLIVKAGQVVNNPTTGKQYKTTGEATFASGSSTSSVIGLIALESGDDSNCNAGTITIVTSSSTVNSFYNVTQATGGTNKESDADFRERIRQYIRGIARSVPDSILYIASQVTDDDGKKATYLEIYQDVNNPGTFTLYVDDGTGTLGNDTETVAGQTLVSSAVGGEWLFWLNKYPAKTDLSYVKVDGVALNNSDYTFYKPWGQLELTTQLTAGQKLEVGQYVAYKGVIKAIQQAIDGNLEDRLNYPAYVGAGILATVESPTIVWLIASLKITLENNAIISTTITDVRNEIMNYVNKLGIGDAVVFSRLIDVVMGVDGVQDVVIDNPTENLYPAKTSLYRVKSTDIAITY